VIELKELLPSSNWQRSANIAERRGGTEFVALQLQEMDGSHGQGEGEMFEYMVVTQKDRVFGGKFNPEKVQEALNAFAQQGWRLQEAVTTTFPGFTGSREELVFFLEREK